MTLLFKSEPAGGLSGRLAAENAFFGPLCTALAIAAGIAVAWGALAGWLASSLFSRSRAPFEYVVVKGDGTPLVGRTDMIIPNHTEYFTLDRKPAPHTPLDSISPAQVPSGLALSALRSEADPLLFRFSDNRNWGTDWYFVAFGNPEGHGYFAGYDVNTRQLVGYIGQSGFQTAEPNVGQSFALKRAMPYRLASSFLAPSNVDQMRFYNGLSAAGTAAPHSFPNWVCHIVSGDRLFRVDLRNRAVTPVFESPGIVGVSIASRPRQIQPRGNGETEYEDCLVVRSPTAVTLLDWQEKVAGTHRLPEELVPLSFSFFPAANGKAVASFSERSSGLENSSNVVEFAPDGKVSATVRHVTRDRGAASIPTDACWMSVAIPEPIVPLVTTFVIAALMPPEDNAPPGYMAAMSELLAMFWLMIVITAVFGAVSAVLYRRQAIRCGERPTVAWMAFVFLAGVPGLLGYWLYRRRPQLVVCPRCRANVPVCREQCLSCGNEFPLPAPNGLEVYA